MEMCMDISVDMRMNMCIGVCIGKCVDGPAVDEYARGHDTGGHADVVDHLCQHYLVPTLPSANTT